MDALPCFGIAELYCWVGHLPDREWRTGTEVEDCLQAHLDHGIRQVAWKLGRSVIEFHTDLPRATLFTGEGHPEPWGPELGQVFTERCVLRAALDFARANGMTLYGRLGMNRHYSKASYGGCFTSRWAGAHPEFHEITKEGGPDPSRLCYAIDDVREERVDLLVEAARIGCEGLQLDFCRQPPLTRYHPALTDSFGADPRPIDPWRGPAFVEWIAHRAMFVTLMLRELHARLQPLRAQTGRAIPVQVRVPDNGLDVALMAGLDVRAWCAEGLMQELSVSSLNWLADFQEHELRPYVELGRKHGVKVFGGVNALALQRVSGALPGPEEISPIRLAERALQQYDAGAEGMTLYQSDFAVWPEELREVLPLLGRPQALAAFAADETNRRRWPLTFRNCLYGLDNHSNPRNHYSMQGREPGV